jgi:hypothetical protein
VLLSKAKFVLVRTMMVLMGLIVAAVAILGIRLFMGPISLGFIKPPIDRILAEGVPGYTATIEDFVLAWSGWDRGLDFQAIEFSVMDAQGDEIARLPRVAVGFETAGLLNGRLAPDSLTIIGPELTLLRRADGTMGFGAVSGGEANYEAVLEQVIDILLTKPKTGGLDRLKRVSVKQATLTITDLSQAQDWRIAKTNFDINKTSTGIAVSLTGDLASSNGISKLEAILAYNREADRTNIDLKIDHMVPSAFQRSFGFWRNLAGIGIPVTLSLKVDAGPQFFVEKVTFDLILHPGRATRPDLFAQPLAISSGHIRGDLNRMAGRLTLQEYKLVFGKASVSGTGTVELADDGERYMGEVHVREMPFTTLARIWPVTFKPFSRGWLARNVTKGVINRLDGSFNLAPGFVPGDPLPSGTFSADLDFTGLEVHFLRPMPPIRNGRGTGTFSEATLDMKLATAEISDPANGMKIDVETARVILDRLNVKELHSGSVTAHATGNVSDLVYITTYEPLNVAKSYSIDPELLGGVGEADIHVVFPLVQKLLFTDVDLDIRGRVEGFSTKIMAEKTEITDGDMDLVIDSDHLEANGNIKIGGLPFDAFWSEKFVPGDGFGSIIRLDGRSTTPELTLALGFVVPFPGSIGINLDMAGNGLSIVEGTGQFDLKDTTISVDALSWTKGNQDPGQMDFTFNVVDDGIEIDHFEVTSEALTARGSAGFGFSFMPRFIDLESLIVGNNSLFASLEFGGDGTNISGNAGGLAIDFRPVIDTVFDESNTVSGFNIELDLNFDKAFAHNEVIFHDLIGLLRIEDSKLRDIHLTGLFADETAFSVSSIPEAQQTLVSLNSDNAGQLIRSLGIFSGADGGELTLTANTDTSVEAGATRGRVRISDFKVVDSPGLSKVLNLASLTGIMDMMSGSGISFERFDLGFSLDQGELRFDNAVAMGPSVGLRMGGRLYDDLGQVEVKGLIIPAYTINTILRSVPIVGDILTGGGHEEVFGIDFIMQGNVTDPDVSVNAASILAPGMIKGIFGGRDTAPTVDDQ